MAKDVFDPKKVQKHWFSCIRASKIPPKRQANFCFVPHPKTKHESCRNAIINRNLCSLKITCNIFPHSATQQFMIHFQKLAFFLLFLNNTEEPCLSLHVSWVCKTFYFKLLKKWTVIIWRHFVLLEKNNSAFQQVAQVFFIATSI